MKDAIHPKYFPNAKVICHGCGTEYTIGSTCEQLAVELCANCHPFYTGKQKLVDTAGRVDRFRARAAKAKSKQAGQDQTKPTEPAATAKPATDETESDSPEARLAAMKQHLESGSDA